MFRAWLIWGLGLGVFGVLGLAASVFKLPP